MFENSNFELICLWLKLIFIEALLGWCLRGNRILLIQIFVNDKYLHHCNWNNSVKMLHSDQKFLLHAVFCVGRFFPWTILSYWNYRTITLEKYGVVSTNAYVRYQSVGSSIFVVWAFLNIMKKHIYHRIDAFAWIYIR